MLRICVVPWFYVRSHKMPEHSLRFAVRTHDGRTTDVWKCWTTTGNQKRDVYMTSRPLGYAMKLSLHESGQWHVGFDSNKKDELFSPEQVPPTRFLGKWLRPEAATMSQVLASRIYFPWASPSEATRDPPPDTVWLESAPEQQWVEVAVFLVNVPAPMDDWPGRMRLGTELVGRLPLGGVGHVCVVHRRVPTGPQMTAVGGTLKYFRDRSEQDLVEANRIVAWGQEPDGSISFIETRLEVSRSSAA